MDIMAWHSGYTGGVCMKIIALYLPQFHNIPENDEWWGKGFTEWVNVKAAEPMFNGHKQPRIPLNNNYYDLLDVDVQKWQADIAKEHGVYGFCYYHYWFSGKMLLEKPMEQMLNHPEIDIPFCICWANENWTKAWVGDEKKVLIEQQYGGKDEWVRHFEYLLPFFADDRYIKIEGKPFLFIYKAESIPCLKEMLNCWQEEAQKAGFPGIHFACRDSAINSEQFTDETSFASIIEWQPSAAISYAESRKLHTVILRKVKKLVHAVLGLHLGNPFRKMRSEYTSVEKIDYEDVWEKVLSMPPVRQNSIPGAFCMWDNTPRHGRRGSVFTGSSPEKFQKSLSKQIQRARDIYNSDYMIIFAWNEWAEGGYLEPDEENGFGYLQAIRGALTENGEWPCARESLAE